MASTLATYFGDEDTVPGGLCGICSFCTSGSAVEFVATVCSAADPLQIKAILAACPERDDPRLLARMAFGITSPRLTVNKWGNTHPLFGSMVSVDFNVLVAAFDVECQKAGYQSVSVPVAANSRKRTYTQANPSSSSHSASSSRPNYSRRGNSSSGQGSNSKRARGGYR